MDLAQIFRELGRRRLWLAAGALVAIAVGILTAYTPSLSPVGLQKRSLELGSAKSEVLIDSQKSPLTDINGNLDPLTARASIYARLMTSSPVVRIIAREARVPAGFVVAGSAQGGEPGSEERATEILGEDKGYRVFFEARASQPLIQVSTQAPTAAEAIRLANASGAGFGRYLSQLQERQGVPQSQRAKIVQIGRAEGGVVNPGVNVPVAILAALGSFIAVCLLILFGGSLRRNLRVARIAEVKAHPADAPPPALGWEDNRVQSSPHGRR